MSSTTKTKTAKAPATTVITPEVKTRIVEYVNNAGTSGKFLNFEENNQGIKFAVWMSNENIAQYKVRPGTAFQIVAELHVPANQKGTGVKGVPAVLEPIREYEGQKQQVLNPFKFSDGIVATLQPVVDPNEMTDGD